jgi:hypothetical protein
MPPLSRTVVCPLPTVWAELHRRLKEASEKYALPPPPAPLILAGWAYANDIEQRMQWQHTLAWAERYGLVDLLDDVSDESMHAVADLSDRRIGPLGGPMYLDWNYEPKPRPDALARTKAIEALRTDWAKIAGAELAAVTFPVRLTGSKGRRLVVLVKTEDAPPWGSWTVLARDERRRSFTEFRIAVNRAIDPLEVDHIGFIRAL